MNVLQAVRRLKPHRQRMVLRVIVTAHARDGLTGRPDELTLRAIDILRREVDINAARLADTLVADLCIQAIEAWKARTIAELQEADECAKTVREVPA